MKEYRLYNRYGIDVRLKETGESGEYVLELPESEQDWLRVSYDSETSTDAEGNVTETIKYYSVDPSGGPYIFVGDNRLSLSDRGEILASVESIRFVNGTGYVIKITSVEERL